MGVYVRLRVASEVYAVPVNHVIEVSELGEVTPVPGSRPEVLGMRNVRGKILPVADLCALLKIRRTSPPRRLLIAEAADQQAGLAIDEVSEVGEMDEPTQETESALLRGATLVGGDLIGVIDVLRVFEVLAGTPA